MRRGRGFRGRGAGSGGSFCSGDGSVLQLVSGGAMLNLRCSSLSLASDC